MKCLYYLVPTLNSTERVSTDLHAAGVNDLFLHVVARDEAGLSQRHIHSSNYLETLDLVRDGFIGTAVGVIPGLVGVGVLVAFKPFGPGLPGIVYLATVGLGILFGAWAGGLTGIATESKKLAGFHHDLEAGRYLILIYAPREQEATIRQLLRTAHPEAQLVGVDCHFINPFRAVQLTAPAPDTDCRLLPKG